MAIYKLIANGSFGPDEIEVMKVAYEAALVNVGVTDRNDPITELIAKAIVNVTASGERDPKQVMERALNALGVRICRSSVSRFAYRVRAALQFGATWLWRPGGIITFERGAINTFGLVSY
jgi:hypothetical protein